MDVHMKRVRYMEVFKAEAIKQITERGHGVAESFFHDVV